MTRLDNPHWEEGEEVRREQTMEGMLDASVDVANRRECEECGDDLGRLSVEHPAHDAVFCSHSCKSTWTNKLHGSLR